MRGSWFLAFVPVAGFLACSIALFVWFDAFDMVGLATGGFISLLIGALFARNYQSYWDAVMRGIANPTSVAIIVILFVIGMFAELVKVTNLSGGFVWIAGQVGLGASMVALFTFVAVGLVAMSTGSSIGTMFTGFPIFFPAGVLLGADPALLAGAIISGAILGDNLAPISDTTIISASTQRFRTRDGVADIGGVVRSRARYSLTAAAIAALLFAVLGLTTAASGVGGGLGAEGSPRTLVMLLPVGLLLATAFLTRDIFKAITVGLVAGTATALLAGILNGSDVVGVEEGHLTGFLVTGVQNIIGTVVLVVAVFGIMGVLNAAGVLDRLVGALQRGSWSRTPRGAEACIGMGISATTVMFGGVNSASMMTFGPVADEIGSKVGLHPYRRCNVMDCFAMGVSCVVPFLSAFLFIGTLLTTGYDGVPAVSMLQLFPAALYPLALTAVMVVAVVTGWGRSFEGPDGAEVSSFAGAEAGVVR